MLKTSLIICLFFLLNNFLFKNQNFYLSIQILSILSIIICMQDYKKLEIDLFLIFLWFLALIIFTIFYKKISIVTLLIVQITVFLSSVFLKKINGKKNIGIADYILLFLTLNLSPEQIPIFFISTGILSIAIFFLHKKNNFIPLAPQILLSGWLVFTYDFIKVSFI